MVACAASLSRGSGGEQSGDRSAAAGELLLRNGSTIVVRPVAAGDEAAIASWFAGLSEETRYERFLAPLKSLDRRVQAQLARIDHVNQEAIAAFAGDGATVGIARYIRLGESKTAEVAVAVGDLWTGLGIATVLLNRIADQARAVGIERLAATCLTGNSPVIRLFRRMGPTTVGPSIAGVVDVLIDLTRVD